MADIRLNFCNFIDKLKTKRMYGDAAVLLELYAEQPEEAITTLIEGSLWDESLRLVSLASLRSHFYSHCTFETRHS